MSSTPQTIPQIALVIPALEPDGQLPALLRALGPEWHGPAVVVDDGSSPAAQGHFAEAERLGATVLRHPANRGKGAALKTAFAHCLACWPDLLGCVTADADGQHTPADILRLAAALRAEPAALWLGCRDFSAPGVPAKSRLGNALSRAALGPALADLPDTQTGLRGIPAGLLPALTRLPGRRYEYETAMLLAACEAHWPIRSLPIATVYEPGNPSSHFRPLRDGLAVGAAMAAPLGRFAASSLACAGIDLGLFTLLAGGAAVGSGRIVAAALGARVVSAGCNFALNRALVFRLQAGGARAAGRYAALCAGQAAASAGLTAWLAAALPWAATACKVCVDLALFFLSFGIQRGWVFAPAAQPAGKEGHK